MVYDWPRIIYLGFVLQTHATHHNHDFNGRGEKPLKNYNQDNNTLQGVFILLREFVVVVVSRQDQVWFRFKDLSLRVT
jgi:hypothetical protein